MKNPDTNPIHRLLVVLPSWVGDAVMAIPALRALRTLLPDAHITYQVRAYVRPLIDASPWHNGLIVTRRPGRPKSDGTSLATRLRRRRFDAAVLFTNSFRSAIITRMAGIPRRIGYDRDGRAALLTDRLLALKTKGRYVPTPAVEYYLGIARYLGAESCDPTLTLFTRTRDDQKVAELLNSIAPNRPRVLLCPGAATKGQSKLWPTDRFAAIADHLATHHQATLLLCGAPNEGPLLSEVAAKANAPTVNLLDHDMNLRRFKSLCKQSDLMIANDTGSRHIGVATGMNVIALFGPTDPQWTRLNMPNETVIRSTAPDFAMSAIPLDAVTAAADNALRADR